MFLQSVTGPDSFSSVTAWHHGAGEKRKHGLICRDSSHDLRRNSLVTTFFGSVTLVYCINVRRHTSDHDTSIHGLCTNHLRIHTHEISQKHARQVRESLVQADGREVDCYTALQVNVSFGSIQQLSGVPMARVEAGRRIDNANNWTRESIFRIAKCLEEDLAQKQRKVRISRRSVLVAAQRLRQWVLEIVILIELAGRHRVVRARYKT